MDNNSVAINSVRSQSFLNETALTKVSCHLLQRIPESADFFRKSMPIYGSVCPFLLYFRNSVFIFPEVNADLRKCLPPFLLYFRNFSRDPSGSQCRFTEVFAHSCFTSVIPSSSFRKSRPIYGSVCPHSCFTSVISTGSFSKSMPFYGSICPFLLYFRNSDFIFQSRPIYGNFCKNAGYFGNSEQPAFKPTHYLKIGGENANECK